MAKVNIRRTNRGNGDLSVSVNSLVVGELKPGEARTMTLSSGRHTIKVWAGPPPASENQALIEIDTRRASAIELECTDRRRVFGVPAGRRPRLRIVRTVE